MKRITAFAIAVLMILPVFTYTVFADDTSVMTNQEYYAAQSYLVAKYKDGKISYSEFQQQTQAVTDEYVSQNTVGGVLQAGALNASNTFNAVAQKIGSTVQKYGDAAKDYISDYISDFLNSYLVLSDKPTTDLKGYGAVVEATSINTPTYAGGSDDASYRQLESCDYVILFNNGNYGLYSSNNKYLNEFYTYFDGHLHMSRFYTTPCVEFRSEYRTYKFYGDIRYEDGTQAPTDDTYETISDYDFSDASDRELEELLKKILEAIELNEPDLSTMEGLLNAIYTRLGTLDSDDDNAMLSAINAAIISLATDTNNNNAELMELLKELRDKKTEGSDIKPVLDELKEINKSLDYLKTVNTLDLVGDTLESLLSLTDTESKFLDTYATLILNLTSKFGYAPVTAMISNIEAIMFNGQPPQDIGVTIYDTQVVLLSSSAFEDLQITDSLNLAKLFVSVLLVISWLYSMRKKITGGA